MLDKLGSCPSCQKPWDAGDTLENLGKMEVFMYKSKRDLETIARSMGYSEVNKSRWSVVSVKEIDGEVELTCPYCGITYDMKTEARIEKVFNVQATPVKYGKDNTEDDDEEGTTKRRHTGRFRRKRYW